MKPNLAAAIRGDEQLTQVAYRCLIEQLKKFGNVPGISQKTALRCVIDGFTSLATGERQGRYAYALPCGTGKTEAVIAWITEASRLDRPYSVMVCATKVEELCEIKRRLLANGVPADDVGLMHSKKEASLPATVENDARRYLLVTHARVKGTVRADSYSTYRGLPRDLIIWDESLLASQHTAISQIDLKKSLGWLAPNAESKSAKPALREAVEYAQYGFRQLRENGDQTLSLAIRKSDEDLEAMINALPNDEGSEAIRKFLVISQEQLRAVGGSGGGGYIQYDIVVPPEFRNIAVLDASYPIRELGNLDKTIKTDPEYAKVEHRGDIKRYENVNIFQLRHASGRGATEDSFSQRRAEGRKVSKEVVHVMTNWIPDDEGVIIFTFANRSKRKVNIAETLKYDMETAGLRPNAKLANGKPKYVFLTWGQETATSAHKHCANVIFAGVLHRDLHDLRGAMMGQVNDLELEVDEAQLLKLRTNEVCYSLHQAMNRSAMRDTVDGQAPDTNVWLIHPDRSIRPELTKVMPGVTWVEWAGKHLPTKSDQTEQEADAIVAFLSRLGADVKRVAIRKVKSAIGSKLSTKGFQFARDDALARLDGWKIEGASFAKW